MYATYATLSDYANTGSSGMIHKLQFQTDLPCCFQSSDIFAEVSGKGFLGFLCPLAGGLKGLY